MRKDKVTDKWAKYITSQKKIFKWPASVRKCAHSQLLLKNAS